MLHRKKKKDSKRTLLNKKQCLKRVATEFENSAALYSHVPFEKPLDKSHQYEMQLNQNETAKKLCTLAAWAVSCFRKMWTLLKIPRNNENIVLSYGSYQHYGIERGLRNSSW